ncbi:MAG: hypothetical protein OHK0023_08090 [Anaerolineae bacterium]
MTNPVVKPTFVFNTAGDWLAIVFNNLIFDTRGEYLGFIEGTSCYTRDGEYVGELAKDGRIFKKRAGRSRPVHPNPIRSAPKPTNMPARAPLPPQNGEVGYDQFDVLEEDPDVFKRVSDRRPDLE